jgi:signal transduction histidine kinase
MAAQGSHKRDVKRTVLIADEDRELTEATSATLDQSGLQTVVTHDGEQALALARALQPDLVLLGVTMPGMSGVEVCATLKTDPVTACIPVIFVMPQMDETERMGKIAASADAHLTKPFSSAELIALVNGVLAGQPARPPARHPDPSVMPADELEVYARELRETLEREQGQRQALEEANQRLDELERLRAVFLNSVTHELVVPFAAIGPALQVLQRQAGSLEPEQQDALDDLMTEIAGLHRLVTGVGKYVELVSRQREPQPEAISLARVIPWAVQPVAVLAQAREVDFRVFVPPDLAKVHADAELLGEAVFQMAHNAVKFNLPGGQAQVQAFESDGWVVIEVTDTGVGLTPERLALLGQPFEHSADALRRGQKGLGVGWAFVRYVAEAYGGWTRVSSAGPDKGSTFSLVVPVATPAEVPGTACEAE